MLTEAAEKLMRNEWGGQNIYFATGTRYHTEWMRQQIRKRSNGQNTVELAREPGSDDG